MWTLPIHVHSPFAHAYKFMLAVSSLSGISQASSSLSDSLDIDLVEEIIDRAPRSATSFPLVYKAYGEVLEEQ